MPDDSGDPTKKSPGGDTSDTLEARPSAEPAALLEARHELRRFERLRGRPLQVITGLLAVTTPLSAGFFYYLISNNVPLKTPLGWTFVGVIALITVLHLLRQLVGGLVREVFRLETKHYVDDLKREHGLVQGLVRDERRLITKLSAAVDELETTQQAIRSDAQLVRPMLSTILELAGSNARVEEALARAEVTSRTVRDTVRRADARLHLIRPVNALHPFGDIYDECTRAAEKALRKVDDIPTRVHRLSEAIHVVLYGLLRVLRRCERLHLRQADADDVRYAANVMVFHPVPPAQIPEHPLCGDLRFEGDGPSFARSRGFLKLRHDLAVVLHGENRAPDTALIDDGDLVLLAPSAAAVESWPLVEGEPPDDVDRSFTTLPGAPIAFGRKEADAFQDALGIEEWIRTQSALDDAIGPPVRAYFERHQIKAIYSQFVGHTLQPPGSLPDGAAHAHGATLGPPVPLGVVNTHLDRSEVLPDRALAGLFATSALPLRTLLERLLSALVIQEDLL